MSKMNILKKNWQYLRSLILVFNFILIYLFYFLFIILKGFASLKTSRQVAKYSFSLMFP